MRNGTADIPELRAGGVAAQPAFSIGRQRWGGAFTLIELLAVMAVIAAIAVGIGFSFGTSGTGALVTAQQMVAGALETARAQAAVNQTGTELWIAANTANQDEYLRKLQVVLLDPTTGLPASFVGNPIFLPRGVFIVPPPTPRTVQGVSWTAGNFAPISTLHTAKTPPSVTVGTAPVSFGSAFWLDFSADGRVNPASGTLTPTGQAAPKLVVSTAVYNGTTLQFNNPGLVRGIVIRPGGSFIAVNNATSF